MYSYTYNSFTLAGNNDSYSWSTEGWDETPFSSMTLEECAEEAHSTAVKLLDIEIDQLEGEFLRADEFNDEGEPLVRNRTLQEIMGELKEDMPYLEAHLYWWMVEAGEDDEGPQDDPAEGGSELYEITHEIMGEWDAPATITEIGQNVAQWHTRGAEYSVKVDLDVVYVYVELDEVNHGTDEDGDMWATDSDFRPSSDNWVQLDRSSYRLEIGELYQAEEDYQVPGQGLLLCLGSLGGRGITPAGSIYIFSSYQDFIVQNPGWHWVQLPEPRWHGVTIVDDIDLPVEGGYQAEWGGNPTRSNDGYTYYPY